MSLKNSFYNMSTQTVKVKIPENEKDITLEQYVQYEKLSQRKDLTAHEKNLRKIKIFTGLSYNILKKCDLTDFEELLSMVEKALLEPVDFQPIITIGNQKFGFITDFDKMQTSEYIDLMTYTKTPDGEEENTYYLLDNLHRVMAILYRPIVAQYKDTYSIEVYKGTSQYADTMKKATVNNVKGMLSFFLNLRSELLESTMKSLPSAVDRVRVAQLNNITTNGVGLQQYWK